MDSTLVIVPTYGAHHWTHQLVKQLDQDHILIIDNMGDYAQISNEFVIVNSENIGWVKSCNEGIEFAKIKNYKHAVLLNNDVFTSSGFIEGLLKAFRPGVGIVGPLQNGRSYPAQMISSIDLVDSMAYTSCVEGVCLCISRDVIDEIGMLDESFGRFGYGADIDYCVRAREADFKIAVSYHSYLHHYQSRTVIETLKMERDKYDQIACKDADHVFNKKHGVHFSSVIEPKGRGESGESSEFLQALREIRDGKSVELRGFPIEIANDLISQMRQ